MATWVWVVVAVAAVAVIAVTLMGASRRRTAVLRARFGTEYDRAVAGHDGRRGGEAELRARERQRAQFDVRPLPEAARLRFAGQWREVQERFVDEPEQAAAAADALITQVMQERGYPMKDFDTQADLVSVDYPGTVEDYRFAHAVQQRSQVQEASTEDLREALVRYRSLFGELLRPEGNGAEDTSAGQAQPTGPNGHQRAAAGQHPGDPGAGAAGRAQDPAETDDSTGPATPDPDNHDHQIGRRGGR